GAIPDHRYLDNYLSIAPRAEVVARARKPLPNDMQLYCSSREVQRHQPRCIQSKEAYAHVHRTLDELNATIASIAAKEYKNRETNDAQRSYLSNNNNKGIAHKLDDDKITKSRHGDEKIGSGVTQALYQAIVLIVIQVVAQAPNQIQDPSPARTLAG
ncbi:hypothetical protein BGX27_006440, partial [Mortierella sp. AM989]